MKILLTLLASVVVTVSGATVPTSTDVGVPTPQVLEVTPAATLQDPASASDSDAEEGKCRGCNKDVERETAAQGRTPYMRFRGRGITGLKNAFKAGSCDEKKDDPDATEVSDVTPSGELSSGELSSNQLSTGQSTDDSSDSSSECDCVATPCKIKKYTLEVENTSSRYDLTIRIREKGGISRPITVEPGKDHKIEFGEPTPADPDAPEGLECGSKKVLEFSMVDGQQNVRELKYTFDCSACPE